MHPHLAAEELQRRVLAAVAGQPVRRQDHGPAGVVRVVAARSPRSACETTCQSEVNAEATLSWLGAESTKLETRLARWLAGERAVGVGRHRDQVGRRLPTRGATPTKPAAHSTSGENAKWCATCSRAATTAGEWRDSSAAISAEVWARGFSDSTRRGRSRSRRQRGQLDVARGRRGQHDQVRLERQPVVDRGEDRERHGVRRRRVDAGHDRDRRKSVEDREVGLRDPAQPHQEDRRAQRPRMLPRMPLHAGRHRALGDRDRRPLGVERLEPVEDVGHLGGLHVAAELLDVARPAWAAAPRPRRCRRSPRGSGSRRRPARACAARWPSAGAAGSGCPRRPGRCRAGRRRGARRPAAC